MYHYCKHDAFCKIVRSGKLWASDVLCMDDRTEIKYAFTEVIRPVVDERDENGDTRYYLRAVASPEVVRDVWRTWCTHVACFSATAELPSQWEKYASCTGYAIGFDQRGLDEWCRARKIALFPMNYELPRQQEMVREFFEGEKVVELRRLASKSCKDQMVHEIRSHANKYLASLTQSVKSKYWSDQQEWRILVIQKEGQKGFGSFTRPDGVCCFELPICTADIVTEVVLAPHFSSDQGAIRLLLRDAGLSSVVIRPSASGCP
ncbi:MAG: DUF2971 domain-containing protein [Bryobacteraceae bacterium]